MSWYPIGSDVKRNRAGKAKGMKNTVLLTKDAQCCSYLPIYGNEIWRGQTPHMDELAAKGTVFTRFFTAAPSSAMSYLAMFTGKYPYQTKLRVYKPIYEEYSGVSLFDKAEDMGLHGHIIWDSHWLDLALPYTKCYGRNTVIHSLDGLRQGVGSHYIHEGFLQPDSSKSENALKMLRDEIAKIMGEGTGVFLWIHLPHVMNGRTCYGSDVDLFDRAVGIVREYFDDDAIYISADHGNMNGLKGKLGYGFDVYEPAIHIPLIGPRKEGLATCDSLVCNVDVFDLLFGDSIPVREYLYSDSAYYAQPHRKLAVVWDKYRYIFNKQTRTEELYDIEWDPNQNFNLIDDFIFDADRRVRTPSRELFYYPNWESLDTAREYGRLRKEEIWREESLFQKAVGQAKKPVVYMLNHRPRRKAN